MANDEPKSKKFKHSVISEHIYDINFQEQFFNNWHNYTAVKTDNLEIIPKPFRVCKISNFLKNDELMDEIKSELWNVKTRRNSIDLYQFEQSSDLADVMSKHLKNLFATFQTDLSTWMKRNTRIELNKKISISSACYSDTDYLLCHDDNMGDRRIAFILYLSKNWEASDGGALELFDTDESGWPRNVVRSLLPEYNSLLFFEVTENSYHQVAEVVSPDKSRWSISGWFHGPLIEKERPARPIFDSDPIDPENTEYDLKQWIRLSYLSPETIKEINIKVEYESCAFLSEFLLLEIYEKLSQEVNSDNIKWKKVGPADQRNYEIADEETLPETLKKFYKLFKSLAMFQMLKKFTDLDLVPLKETMKPKMRIELQRWNIGCYTLLSDNEVYDNSASTDKKSVINNDDRQQNVLLRPNNCLGETINTPPSSEDDVTNDEILNNTNNPNIASSAMNDDESDSGEADIEENEDEEMRRRILNRKPKTSKRVKLPLSDFEMKRGTDSEESDIDDYLSDPKEYDEEQENDNDNEILGGSLDVILQFHTNNVPENLSIDYVCPREESTLIHVPAKDNYLCLAYKINDTCRVHNYVNHYCKGFFYNLLCTYYE
ncbi:prolyl 3-hydroxylase OGFOD1 [Leptopilina heterotoma]|uniref:prolyl 3-hydroxylase OGFOD1 n=1 Tax=Leptopilina heterotoma TaxID=63436 RepID=UPI001CA91419|nr:prolyl 3-hydroxylase OGFOD1 [Leptopilina heterotoma]